MTAQVVVFPDAEAETITYLKTQLTALGDTAHVGNRIPDARPDRIVNLYRTGGGALDIVRDGVQLTIDAWDVKYEDAHDLGQLVRGLMRAMPYRKTVGATAYRVLDTGFGPLPHPDTEQFRFTFTLRIDFRGSPLP